MIPQESEKVKPARIELASLSLLPETGTAYLLLLLCSPLARFHAQVLRGECATTAPKLLEM